MGALAGVVVDMSVQKDLPRPTAGRPLKIYFGGDSMAGYPVVELSKLAAATKVMQVTGDSVVSSRLCDNAKVNWPARLRARLAAAHRNVVVFMIGANDAGASITVNGTFPF